jgi:hypothetical protein
VALVPGGELKPQVNGAAITAGQIALLQSGRFLIAELYTFNLALGVSDYFTSLDMDVLYNGVTYKSKSLRIEGLHFKLGIGTSVDEQTLKISAYPSDVLAGGNFFTSVLDGALDGCFVARDRAFWTPTTGYPYLDYGAAPALVVRLFYGPVSTVTKAGRTHAEIKVKSPLNLLNLDMPRNYYTPGCLHTLFDSGCTLVKAFFGKAGKVGASPTTLVIPWSGGVNPVTGGDGLDYYAQGRVQFLNGPNENVQFAIGDNDGNNLYLQHPMDVLPNVGDDFIAYAGCTKTLNTCTAKFSNQAHFRGFPLIPPVYVSV